MEILRKACSFAAVAGPAPGTAGSGKDAGIPGKSTIPESLIGEAVDVGGILSLD